MNKKRLTQILAPTLLSTSMNVFSQEEIIPKIYQHIGSSELTFGIENPFSESIDCKTYRRLELENGRVKDIYDDSTLLTPGRKIFYIHNIENEKIKIKKYNSKLISASCKKA